MVALNSKSEGGAAKERHPQEPPALQVEGLSKHFGAVLANDAVTLTVSARTVHAVVGENGAGKTTLMRMVYGLYVPDAGTIRLNGIPMQFGSPRDALSEGVAMVHQTSLLVGSLTVAENIQLSLTGRHRLARRAVADRLVRLSADHGLGVDPHATIDSMSVGMRQRVEILAALFHKAKLLILDEPTTVLTPIEANQLFDVLRELTELGTTVVLVTHKLREVLAIADSVTVLRSGRVVAEAPTSTLDERELVHLMVGRDIALSVSDPAVIPQAPPTRGEPLLQVDDLVVVDDLHVRRINGVSLAAYPGEIVAVSGVEGNGQRELVQALIGLRRPAAGRIRLAGTDITGISIGARRRRGLAYIPESRPTEGLAGDLSLEDNLVLGQHRRSPFAWHGLRNARYTRQFAIEQINQFDVVADGPTASVNTLSGGNAQKVVVAREVSKRPRVLIAVQPTQGVDVAAAYAIRRTLQQLRDSGMSIVLVTSDLREACDLCDRAIVLYNGMVAGEKSRAESSEESLGALAMGVPA